MKPSGSECMRNTLIALLLLAFLPLALAQTPPQVAEHSHGAMSGYQGFAPTSNPDLIVYKNEACGHCDAYLQEFYAFLKERGILNVQEKLLINDPFVRAELTVLNQEKGVPLELQGHMTVVVGNRLFLEGHVPVKLLRPLFDQYALNAMPELVVLQDSMDSVENLATYKLLDKDRKVKECRLDQPLSECTQLPSNAFTPSDSLLPLVLFTGLVDGINPCAFGVLLFFIAFLYTLHRSRGNILKLGAVYVCMIFLTYVLIGLGILQAIVISGEPHLLAKVSAGLTALLALVNLKDYFWYGKGFTLKIPDFTKPALVKFTEKASLPAVIVLGFLVGLCEFPCSGGIYVGILSLLSLQTKFWEGLAYLLLYNVMFVLPLIVILGLAANKRMVLQMEKWDVKNKRRMKLASGLVMLALAAILWWFSR